MRITNSYFGNFMDSLDFYKKHSVVTNPEEYGYLFDEIPLNISSVKALLTGLILHFWDGDIYNYQIPFKRLFDIETRYVSKMLKKIWDLDNTTLMSKRPLDKRIVGSCRDYSTLFCSILRHHGIPARTRVAFATYYFDKYNHDVVILEYWNYEKKRWCLVDTRANENLIRKHQIKIDFDLLDVPRDKLVVAGLAWQMVRDNKAEADEFGGGNLNKNKGMWYLRDRLIQDFAALNSMEMQLWDTWGLMLKDQKIEDDETQLKYLDKIAQLTINPDKHLKEVINQFEQDIKLKIPQKIISYSPIYKRREISLEFFCNSFNQGKQILGKHSL